MSARIRRLGAGLGSTLRLPAQPISPTPHTPHTVKVFAQLNSAETTRETTGETTPQWMVTVRRDVDVVSAFPCPDLGKALALAGIVRRFWPDLRVTMRRHPRARAAQQHLTERPAPIVPAPSKEVTDGNP